MKQARVCIVVAMAKKSRAIGKEGRLLWHISEDMKRFKRLTLGHPVIMGRKTFESILDYLGTPLPGRTNIVVTRNASYRYDGVVVTTSLKEALAHAHTLDTEEIHVGGGSEIYTEALPFVDRLYLTLIDADDADADAFFPDYSDFTKIMEKETRDQDGLAYEWVTLERAS